MKERKPNRLNGFDYSQDNLYFVTSCVHGMVCCFGDVVRTGHDHTGHDPSVHDLSVHDLSVPGESRMILNDYGKIADQQWYWLAKQYPYIILHEFIVMPNHIHGIIEINRDAIVVGTGRDLSVPVKSLSGLMGAYKTTVSKKIHLLNYDEFAWQRSFYDHIIRDERSYEKISDYIINNPNAWLQDKFFNK